MRLAAVFVSFTSLALLVGCSGEDTHSVTGQVTFTDGTPVPMVKVVMDNQDGKSGGLGYADAEGKFEMMFNEPGDGLPVGVYNVAVVPPDGASMAAEDEKAKLSPGVGWGVVTKYRDSATSGITFTVEAKKNTFDLQIEKGDGPPMNILSEEEMMMEMPKQQL